jgi:hypothetical protein
VKSIVTSRNSSDLGLFITISNTKFTFYFCQVDVEEESSSEQEEEEAPEEGKEGELLGLSAMEGSLLSKGDEDKPKRKERFNPSRVILYC